MDFRTLKASEIECRIGTTNEKGISLLLYKDARCDMTLLDETVGSMNWKRQHTRDNANCVVSIYDADKHDWVSKEDTGTESNTEAEKGLASDSFKRACVNWGIGRELYTAPFIWVGANNCNIVNGRNGKPTCYDKFRVKEISYNESREIKALQIVNEKTGKLVYAYGEVPVCVEQTERTNAVNPKSTGTWGAIPTTKYTCEKCGRDIEDFTTSKGMLVQAEYIATQSRKQYGKCLCMECSKAAKNEVPKQ